MSYKIYTLDEAGNETTSEFSAKKKALADMMRLNDRQKLGWGYLRVQLFNTVECVQVETEYDINE